MVVVCIETNQDKIVKKFVKETHQRVTENSMASLMFKKDSFAYCIKDKDKYNIIVNLEPLILKLPKIFVYFVFKRGLKKKGYKGEIRHINNNMVFIKTLRVFKKWDKKKFIFG